MDVAGQIDVLLAEGREVAGRIVTFSTLSERVLTIGAALVGVIATQGLIFDKPWILMSVPFALCLLLTVAVHLYTEASALAGYKVALEERVNQLADQPLVLWESQLAVHRHRDASAWSMRILLGVAGAGFVALSVWAACQAQAVWLGSIPLTVGSIVIGMATLASAMVRESRVRSEMLVRARAEFTAADKRG